MPNLALQEVTVTATSYANDPDIEYGFEADSTTVVNRETTTGDEVRFSFDGVGDHGVVVAALVPFMSIRSKRTAIWLRRTSAGSSVVNVLADTVR